MIPSGFVLNTSIQPPWRPVSLADVARVQECRRTANSSEIGRASCADARRIGRADRFSNACVTEPEDLPSPAPRADASNKILVNFLKMSLDWGGHQKSATSRPARR